MKTQILSLVAILLLGASSALAQLSSSPVEPGLHDHLRSQRRGSIELLNDRMLTINGISAEWVSSEQITLSAVVVELRELTAASRERLERHVGEYNAMSAVGTLVIEQGTIRMQHHLNPRLVSPTAMSAAVDRFKVAVEQQRALLGQTTVTIR